MWTPEQHPQDPNVRRRTDPDPPPPWSNGPLTLYHGTVLGHWMEIARDGVRVDRGRTGTDFGRGFYVTADRDQALRWATGLAAQAGDRAVVAFAAVSRDLLASLHCLFFVRGHEGAEDFWSFVAHCRRGRATHGRADEAGGMYDIVVGPVSRNYKRRLAYGEMDQIGFHTPAAQEVLNSVPWSVYDPAD
jgi:hypothetical protein